jgi:hypothetical protein
MYSHRFAFRWLYGRIKKLAQLFPLCELDG